MKKLQNIAFVIFFSALCVYIVSSILLANKLDQAVGSRDISIINYNPESENN